MKRVVIVLSVLFATMNLMAESAIRHIDTNGEKGACLFREDANGFAEFKEVVPFQFSQEEALANVEAWAKGLGKSVAVFDLKTEENIVSFHGRVDVNPDLSLFRVMVGDSARYYAKAESHLAFDCEIEVREGRLRYRFFNLLSERDGRKGDFIEDNGPINDLYWNRVNGLKQFQAKKKGQNDKATAKALDEENKLYQIEYQVIADLGQSIRKSMMSYVEEEW